MGCRPCLTEASLLLVRGASKTLSSPKSKIKVEAFRKRFKTRFSNFYFTTKKEGSGIGSIDFESTPAVGTIFRLRIPLAESRLDALKEVATSLFLTSNECWRSFRAVFR